jgi:hypothetical protein
MSCKQIGRKQTWPDAGTILEGLRETIKKTFGYLVSQSKFEIKTSQIQV